MGCWGRSIFPDAREQPGNVATGLCKLYTLHENIRSDRQCMEPPGENTKRTGRRTLHSSGRQAASRAARRARHPIRKKNVRAEALDHSCA
jgi:hypothetical protein